jgi:DNA-binding HxlR family transcriptional regulator
MKPPTSMKARAKTPAAPCATDCPVRKTARLLDGKWTTLIVRDLLGGKKRYTELLKSLAGVSPKMLAARLRFLEYEGLVTKTVFPVIPPKTEYALTPLGKKLAHVIHAMRDFGEGLR